MIVENWDRFILPAVNHDASMHFVHPLAAGCALFNLPSYYFFHHIYKRSSSGQLPALNRFANQNSFILGNQRMKKLPIPLQALRFILTRTERWKNKRKPEKFVDALHNKASFQRRNCRLAATVTRVLGIIFSTTPEIYRLAASAFGNSGSSSSTEEVIRRQLAENPQAQRLSASPDLLPNVSPSPGQTKGGGDN